MPKSNDYPVALMPGSFVQLYQRLGRKPDLRPVKQSVDALVFVLEADERSKVPMTITIDAEGTWTVGALLPL